MSETFSFAKVLTSRLMTLVCNDERCVNEVNNQWHRYDDDYSGY